MPRTRSRTRNFDSIVTAPEKIVAPWTCDAQADREARPLTFRPRGAPPAWLDLESALQGFGPDRETQHTEYRSFVLAKIGCEDRLSDRVTNAIDLGTETWTKAMRKVVESKPCAGDHPTVQRAVGRPKMHAIVQTVARLAKIPQDTIRTRAIGALRWLIAWIGWNDGLLELTRIAAALRLRSEGHDGNMMTDASRSPRVPRP